MPPADEEEFDASASRTALWQKLLRAAVSGRYLPLLATRDRERPRVGRGAGGCLMRLMLVIVLMFVALVSAVFLFGRALLY